MTKTILITGSTLPDEFKQDLERKGYTLKIERPDLTEEELIGALQGVSAYILGGAERATRRVIEASATDLRVIAFFGTGYHSYVDTQAASECGIAVANTPGANAQSVAEFTIALMIDAMKRLTYLVNCTKQGDWKEYSTSNLQGKTLGIVGLGAIGSCVARIAHNGFGMNILYTSRSRKHDVEREVSASLVTLDDLLRQSDVVSLHAASTPDTRGMIGPSQFRLMKPSAILVNAARPELVDAGALRAALVDRQIAVAAFDGYFQEPAPRVEEDQYGLIGLSNEVMLISPHTAYLTDDAARTMAQMSVESVLAVLEGLTARYVVNPEYVNNLHR